MSDIAIRVDGLSKQYRIGGPQARYKTLRESLVSAARAPIRRAGRLLRGEAATDHQETIWALKDVSFEVKHGEVLGIIGRNGAGKSTLLKVLSRITAPTEGTVDLYGRVGSLLEVGTGFHPELTGRENVYLNGAIMGMKRAEIDRKFDEIVAFAELEKFLDTPVKHYSSGMYVRLAFAVAAHLEPEILLVDEVLAVGDARFQKKCVGKMESVSAGGRTVLVVSHNMSLVQTLCPRAIVLHDGQIYCAGEANEAIRGYFQTTQQTTPQGSLDGRTDRDGSGELRYVAATVSGVSIAGSSIQMGEDLRVSLDFTATRDIANCNLGFNILNSHGEVVYRVITRDTIGTLAAVKGRGRANCTIREPRLLPGMYSLNIVASKSDSREILDLVRQAVGFEIVEADVYGTGKIPNQGFGFAQCEWEVDLNGADFEC